MKDHIEHQQQVLQLLKDNATLVQNRMKQQVDQHRSEKCFDVGDWVFLLLHLKQAIYEKEMLAILHALKKWRPYRMGRLFKDEDVEALFCAISIIQLDWINKARMNGRRKKKCGYSFKSCRRSQFKQYCEKLKRKEKPYWNLEKSHKQEPFSYEIDQFQSISSSGRIYRVKIPHGRTIILYRSIKNYSSVEDKNF